MKLKKLKKYDAGGVVDQNFFGNQPFAAGKPKKQRLFADGGVITSLKDLKNLPTQTFDTPLDEKYHDTYQNWLNKNGVSDFDKEGNGYDYDYKGAFLAGINRDGGNGHFPDTFKKPNHETFSNESQYANMVKDLPKGHWDGDNFVKYTPDYNASTPIPMSSNPGSFGKQAPWYENNRLNGPSITFPNPEENMIRADGGNVQPMSNISLSKPYLPNTPIQIGNSMNVIAEQGANRLKKAGVMSPQAAMAYRLPQTNPLFAQGGKVYKFDDGGSIEGADAATGALSGAATGVTAGLALAPLTAGLSVPIGAIGGALVGGIGGFFKGKNDYDVQQEKLKAMQPQNTLQNLPPPAYGNKFANGGQVSPNTTINVEKNELETKGGRMITDFSNKPKHPNDGSMNPQGNTIAQKGNTIIPAHMRSKYIGADLIKRKEIESNLKSDQNKRQQFANRKFAEGGYVGKFDDGGTTWSPVLPNSQPDLTDLSMNGYVGPAQTISTNSNTLDTRTGQPINADTPSIYANNITNGNIYPEVNPIDTQNRYNSWSPVRPVDTNPLGNQNPSLAGLTPAMVGPVGISNPNTTNNGFDAKKLIPYASNITNAILTANTPKYANPVLNNHIALNNRLEIQPQLDDINNSARGTLNAIAGRTNSGSVYRATAGDLYSKSQDEKNKVYANAANYKNGIDNQQVLENSGIDQGNNKTTNDYNYLKTARLMSINKSLSNNVDDAATKYYNQNHDQDLIDADSKKALIVAGIFNNEGELDRTGLEKSWPTLSAALKAKMKIAYPNQTQNLN